jgi:hypothetical protein
MMVPRSMSLRFLCEVAVVDLAANHVFAWSEDVLKTRHLDRAGRWCLFTTGIRRVAFQIQSDHARFREGKSLRWPSVHPDALRNDPVGTRRDYH